MKIARKSNLMTVREKVTRKVSLHIEPAEKRAVLSRVNEVAYYLYDHYRTAFFADADDITDSAIGEVIGWPTRKVSKYRVELQKANLIRIIKVGTGETTITKLLVGMDVVALSDAGLPDNIQDHNVFRKLKRSMKIDSTEELISRMDDIQAQYELNPDRFK